MSARRPENRAGIFVRRTSSPKRRAASSCLVDRRRRRRTVRASFARMRAWMHWATTTVYRARPLASCPNATFALASQVSASSISLKEDLPRAHLPRDRRSGRQFASEEEDRDGLEAGLVLDPRRHPVNGLVGNLAPAVHDDGHIDVTTAADGAPGRASEKHHPSYVLHFRGPTRESAGCVPMWLPADGSEPPEVGGEGRFRVHGDDPTCANSPGPGGPHIGAGVDESANSRIRR